MKEFILNIYHKVGISSSRTRNIAKHVGISFFLKGGSIIANFLLVSLTINYLTVESYGVWLTLSSFIAWFSFFDIGLGNGLRNKFAEAKASNNNLLAKAYVSVAYYTIGTISSLVIIFIFLVNSFIDWAKVFNTSQSNLNILIPIIFSFFMLQLVAKLITTIYTADQHHSVQDKVQFVTQILSLVIIWLLTKFGKSSLLIFGVIFSVLPVLILLGLNIFAFKNTYKIYKPDIRLWKSNYLKDIMGLGLSFFVIQIAALILFTTDNFIISNLFSPKEVVPYNIANKYFSILLIGYSLIITPYWSTFTEAYAAKDFEWIKIAVKNIQKLWMFIPICLFLMVLGADWFYYLWIGDIVDVPPSLSYSMAFFVLLISYNTIYVYFINGIGKIRLQLIISIIVMTINIPLSILFASTFRWGSTGVILATCVCLIPSVIIFPIQYKKILNGSTYDIWNK